MESVYTTGAVIRGVHTTVGVGISEAFTPSTWECQGHLQRHWGRDIESIHTIIRVRISGGIYLTIRVETWEACPPPSRQGYGGVHITIGV